jgi:hypothetical protein
VTIHDEPRGRLTALPPAREEPPFDPEYDTQPNPLEQAARDAERGLLGTLLLKPEDAADILPVLDPTDFASPAHEAIWNAAAELHADDVIPDHPAMLHQLAGDPIFKQAGGVRLLAELVSDAPVFPQPEYHAGIIRDAAALRRFDTALAEVKRARNTADASSIHTTLEKLSDLVDTAATTFGPRGLTPTATGLHDLTWILTGEAPTQPPPVYATRTDGHALFYAAKVNGIFGDPESGKTWLAQAAAVDALNRGGTAAMIDVDHNGPDHTAARLLLLGAHITDLADPTRFRYYEPEDGDQLRAAVDDCVNRTPDVLVIDSIGEVFPMLGVSTNDADEITGALRQVCSRPAAAGACVITIDHLPKSTEARNTGFATGSIAKKRMIRGSYLRAEVRAQPTPGQIGRVTLRIEKDFSGELRKTSGGGYAGTLVLDSTQPHITKWSIDREHTPTAADGKFRPTGRMEAVSRFVEDNDQCTFTDVKEAVEGKDATLRRAITLLAEEGFLTVIRSGNKNKHHSIAHYREAEDDRRNAPQDDPWETTDEPLL